MKITIWGALSTLLLIAGCSQSLSGAYIARGQQFSELLQITQSHEGQLLGTLTHIAVKPDGSIERITANISGVTDGHSITLIAKANEPLSTTANMSGTVDGSMISITQPNGVENFVKADAKEYQDDAQKLVKLAADVREHRANALRQQQMTDQQIARQEAEQHRIAQENTYAAALSDALNQYAQKIQAHQDLTPFHQAHAKILAAAQHDLVSRVRNS